MDLKGILLIALVFIPFERITLLRPKQPVLRAHWVTDLVYLLVNGIPIQLGLSFLLGVGLVSIRWVVPDAVGTTVRLQPIWLQTIEVILIADLGFYIGHRAHHQIPFLWRFHAVHHSIEEMDWLAAHRIHPVDQILTKTISILPVLALGFSETAIAIFAVSFYWQSRLIHANTWIKFGPLKWVVASPEFHHWHHANERAAFDKNFAAQLPFIDALFGTLFVPRNRMPETYGIDDPVPALYHEQLAYPLRGKGDRAGQPEVEPTAARAR